MPYQFKNKTLAKHAEAIRSDQVTKTTVIGIRKALNLAERAWGRGSVPSHVTDEWREEVRELERLVSFGPTKVIGELHDTGLAVLRNPRYKTRLRSNERLAWAIDNLDHFRLLGFVYIGNSSTVTPVYEVHSKDYRGEVVDAFTFQNIPWQSGGNGPEIRGMNPNFMGGCDVAAAP